MATPMTISLRSLLLAVLICVNYAWCPCAVAESTAPALAILNFFNNQDQIHADGEQLEEIIFATLAECREVRLLERQNTEKIAAERQLSLNSMTSNKQSIELGALIGADYLLTGRIYNMDGKVYFNARLINCRNTVVRGITGAYPENMSKDEMFEQFAQKIKAQISKTFANSNSNSKTP